MHGTGSPMIVLFAVAGAYSLNRNPFGVYAIAVFGVLGYLLISCGCEPAPLLLGFVLGPLVLAVLPTVRRRRERVFTEDD